MNNRKLSRSIDYETSTLYKRDDSVNGQQPVRRKTYAGNITCPVNDFGENNNLKHFDGISLVKENRATSLKENKIQELYSTNKEFISEVVEDDANDYLDVYLRKITKTR